MTFNFGFQAHAKWLIENDKFQHSAEYTYGENICRIEWKPDMYPTEEDKLAIATRAVELWYKEHLNYSRKTSNWNGNIYHDEQIGHFLQVS